ncbi:aldehyde dehydrogenase (NADP(+)) [Lunatibacter salilacus]|uniref:aldehyde dehydrogenase (NADP(+)) n=1 Tax=Lunatibacter salilacus TaxID=2483804 RepID=UPI00131B57C7|nr:aldehyde dehydrogenase (NADP(+)) [Lunatibacter salilacus]
MSDLNANFKKAQQAFTAIKSKTVAEKAAFLEAMAVQIENIKSELIPTASKESNLPDGRITGELGRTLGQIRLFANLVKEGSWVEATIDHADPDRSPAPKPDIRRMLRPLGPVVVFGASNFPLAFSTAGGDTVSALAAGCPVIYKAHPAHPATSKLVAGAIRDAAQKSGMPEDIFQHLEGGISVGQEMAKHPMAKAIAFTGSYTGGKALFDTAAAREEPIPVYAEMGSVNPIFAFESKLSQHLDALATAYVGSLTLGVGQFCTNPGLIFVPESKADAFSKAVAEKIAAVSAAPMLHDGIAKTYKDRIATLKEKDKLSWVHAATASELTHGSPALARVTAADWISDDAFQEEVFGPFGILVSYKNTSQLVQIADSLKGQLTCTLWAEDDELAENVEFLALIEEKCGRLLFKGAPTGVEVGFAMQHGGPFPSTSDSRSTSVGVYAIKRFARPVAFQDMPERFLPEELKESNPLDIWRTVDGVLKK